MVYPASMLPSKSIPSLTPSCYMTEPESQAWSELLLIGFRDGVTAQTVDKETSGIRMERVPQKVVNAASLASTSLDCPKSPMTMLNLSSTRMPFSYKWRRPYSQAKLSRDLRRPECDHALDDTPTGSIPPCRSALTTGHHYHYLTAKSDGPTRRLSGMSGCFCVGCENVSSLPEINVMSASSDQTS